jgi:hypothetical protein
MCLETYIQMWMKRLPEPERQNPLRGILKVNQNIILLKILCNSEAKG